MNPAPPDVRPAAQAARESFDATPWHASTGWRAWLLALRHSHAVGHITLVSIVASVLVTTLNTELLGNPADLVRDLISATVVPLIVAPLVSHHAMGLLYEVEAARAQLHLAATRDSLTNAYNRRFFMARLEGEVPRAQRTGVPLSVIMIDIDHFKAINDTHGHAAGDAVLEDIAGLLTRCMRTYDLVARYGGEEFVALMPGADLCEAQAAAERLRVAVQDMQVAWLRAGGTVQGAVTASLGVTCLGDDGDTPGSLLARADSAMYAAKRGGRNRCVVQPPAPAIQAARAPSSEAPRGPGRVADAER